MQDRPLKKPTSYDVARLAGVHRSAVSRAFSENGRISEETKRRVIEAADTLGYRVNYLARGLQQNTSGLVGVVASRLDTPYRALQVKHIARELLRYGLTPILITAENNYDVGNLMSGLLNYNVAGMIITSDTPPDDIIDECARLSVPIVLINRDATTKGADRVQLDVEEAGRLAFKMLRDGGVRKFCVLEPEERTYSVAGRAEVFAQCCRDENLPVMVLKAGGQKYTDGLSACEEIAGAKEQIEGVFCAIDLLALGVLDGLRLRHNIAVPDDIQVLGFDNIEQAGWLSNNLTTIEQEIEVSAVLAVDLVTKRLADPKDTFKTVSIPIKPVHRGTTKRSA